MLIPQINMGVLRDNVMEYGELADPVRANPTVRNTTVPRSAIRTGFDEINDGCAERRHGCTWDDAIPRTDSYGE